jgi:hypothetical protein
MNGCGAKSAPFDRSNLHLNDDGWQFRQSVRTGVALSRSKSAALSVNFLYRDSDGSFGPVGVCRFESRLLLGHRFGAIPAPGGSSLFCFGCAALRVTVSLKILFAKFSEKISREPP